MPGRRANPAGYSRARGLRKRPTLAESRLWAHLRRGQLRGVVFRRQHAIGRYVVDFCSPRHRLVIELDGRGHMERSQSDLVRTTVLESEGYRVIRFWNNQVMNDIEGVIAVIIDALKLA